MEVLILTYFGFDAFVHIMVMMLIVMLTGYDAYSPEAKSTDSVGYA